VKAREHVRLTDEDLAAMTKYMPESEPFLAPWLRLHVWHMIAMEAQQYYEACKVADAKYDLYLRDCRSRVDAWARAAT
jgi:hypothetical protein